MLPVRLVIVTSFPSGEITGPVYKFRVTRWWELGRGGVDEVSFRVYIYISAPYGCVTLIVKF